MWKLAAPLVISTNVWVVRPVFFALLTNADLANVQVTIGHLVLAVVFVESGEVFLLSAAATSFHLKMGDQREAPAQAHCLAPRG